MPDIAAARLVKAFITNDQLPRARGPRPPGDHWTGTITTSSDRVAQAESHEAERWDPMSRQKVAIRPSPAEVSEMELMFDALRDLNAIDAALARVLSLWAMHIARRRSIRALCREKKWNQVSFYRSKAKALKVYTGLLDAKNRKIA